MHTAVSHTETIIAGQTGYVMPVVASVTGHRDLIDD
jgi:hypothetical protein